MMSSLFGLLLDLFDAHLIVFFKTGHGLAGLLGLR
jgi:hypothetical protein